MHAPQHTSDLLTRLLRDDADVHLVDQVIDRTVDCARRYIQWLVWHRGYHLGPTGLSAEDLAYDLVAELVSELDGQILGRLKSALRSLAEGPDTGEDLESAFIAVVNRTVRLNLSRLFVEINPLQARLLRALRRYSASSDDILRIDSVSGYWYARADGDPRLHLPALHADQLRSVLVTEPIDGHPVRSVLHAALEAVSRVPDVRQAVFEHDILDITLSLLQSQHIADTPSSVAEDEGDGFAAGNAFAAAMEEARSWVSERYVRRGKLTGEEADAMFRAMALYVDDLQRDDALGHFTYLRQVFPGLTQERYRKSYRNVYEYILRRIFTNARKRLE